MASRATFYNLDLILYVKHRGNPEDTMSSGMMFFKLQAKIILADCKQGLKKLTRNHQSVLHKEKERIIS